MGKTLFTKKGFPHPAFSKRFFNLILRLSLLALSLLLASRFAVAEIAPDEEWFLMYKGDAPIGYTHARVTPLPAAEGEPRLVEIESDIWIRLAVGDEIIDSSIVSREVVNEKFRLVSAETEWKIGEAKIAIVSLVDEKRLGYTLMQGESVKESEIEYPYGCIPLGTVVLLLRELDLSAPADREFCVLNTRPEGPRLSRLVMPKGAVKEENPDEPAGAKIYRVKMKLDGVPLVYRIGGEGWILEAIQPTLGFVQRRVERSVIPKVEDLPAWDLLQTTASPAPEGIPDPAELERLEVLLEWSGVSAGELALEAANQSVGKLKKRRGGYTAAVSVGRFAAASGVFAATPSARFPTRSPLLGHTPVITASSPLIIEKTTELLRGATNTFQKVELLAGWIYANIHPDPRSWSEVTTAEEVLAQRIGMNKHYAVLFAAMARAAGIPTGICAGRSYSFGFFVDHYWNEALIGDTWVPVDATTPSLSPPPLNIKLAEGAAIGEVSDVLARLHPKLKIHITGAE